MRPMTKRLAVFYGVAVSHDLPDPLGRAVYCANRAYNATVKDPLRLMSNARPETAERWRLHWEAGGGLKALTRFATVALSELKPGDAVVVPPAPLHRRAICLKGEFK